MRPSWLSFVPIKLSGRWDFRWHQREFFRALVPIGLSPSHIVAPSRSGACRFASTRHNSATGRCKTLELVQYRITTEWMLLVQCAALFCQASRSSLRRSGCLNDGPLIWPVSAGYMCLSLCLRFRYVESCAILCPNVSPR